MPTRAQKGDELKLLTDAELFTELRSRGFVIRDTNMEGDAVPAVLTTNDPVNHPSHYNDHPSGVECITITEAFDFNIGNAIKYLWRAGRKEGSPAHEDLEKAIWYVRREQYRARSTQVIAEGRRFLGQIVADATDTIIEADAKTDCRNCSPRFMCCEHCGGEEEVHNDHTIACQRCDAGKGGTIEVNK